MINCSYSHSGKPFDISNLMNPTGKDFDENQSSVLSLIMQQKQLQKPNIMQGDATAN